MERALPKKRRQGLRRTEGSAILEVVWKGYFLCFPGLGTSSGTEERIPPQSISGVFTEFFWNAIWEFSAILRAPPRRTVSQRLQTQQQQIATDSGMVQHTHNHNSPKLLRI